MTQQQSLLLAHWIKHMPIQPAYIADAIKRHFQCAPWDEAVLKPIVAAEWLRLQSLKAQS